MVGDRLIVLLLLLQKCFDFYLFFSCDHADYIEKKASSLGLRTLFLLTTRTADWYVILISLYVLRPLKLLVRFLLFFAVLELFSLSTTV